MCWGDALVNMLSCYNQQANPDVDIVLTNYSPGNYFGELALIQNQPRAASAYAEGKVKVAGKLQCFLNPN